MKNKNNKQSSLKKIFRNESESKRKFDEGWTAFSLKVREYEREYPTEEAIKMAIVYCIDNGIHKEYLEKNSFHIFNIMLQIRADQRNRS